MMVVLMRVGRGSGQCSCDFVGRTERQNYIARQRVNARAGDIGAVEPGCTPPCCRWSVPSSR